MREVEVTRFVPVRPDELEAALSPEAVVAAEGTFAVSAVEETDEGTVVTATGPGMAVPLRFTDREAGLAYVAEGEAGPFDHLETEVTVAPENEGSLLTMRSSVSLNVPLPFADRVAAWKRRGELERAIEALAEEAP